jgi:hypothetical protein
VCRAHAWGIAGWNRGQILLGKNGPSVLLKNSQRPQLLRALRTVKEMPFEFFNLGHGQVAEHVPLNGLHVFRIQMIHLPFASRN